MIDEIIEKLLNDIPEYTEFLTLAELDESARRLADAHPDCVELFELGKTRQERPILGLKIGNGSKNALFFGCPHPNEPIGTMLIEYFSKTLAENPALREKLDYTFYFVKAWDADGLARNEKWLKGPYTIFNYSRNFYRPAANVQVDWSFPIDYKKLHFHDVMPETQAMMELIDRIKPTFTYALHNAGFGGVYWYVTEDMPDIYPALAEAPKRQNIPLHLGEPESPSIQCLGPAVLLAEGIEADYDYYENLGGSDTDITKIITSGTCSDAYSRKKYGTFTFLTELPYFFDPRIADPTPMEVPRKDAVIKKLTWMQKSNGQIREILADTQPMMHKENPFLCSVLDNIEDSGIEYVRKMAESDPDYQRPASVAEYFDNVWVSRFYQSLTYGMLIRAYEYEREQPDAANVTVFATAQQKAEALHKALCDELEHEMNYSVIPIKKLISIQLECGLKMASHIYHKK